MQFDETTQRRDITVSSVVFSVIQPYEGDPASKGYMIEGKLSSGEAHALNQTLAENFRNNFRETAAQAIEKGEQEKDSRATDALQAEMEEHMLNYEFGQRTGGIRALDPVFRMMREMARKIVSKRVKDKGEKLSDMDTESFNRAVDDLMARHHDQLKAKAEAAVEQERNLLADLS